MKKIIFIFLTLFIFIPVSLALTDFRLGEKTTNIKLSAETKFILRDDNKFIYSLSPIINFNELNSYEGYTYINSKFNIIQTQLDKLNIASYYGYNNTNHKDEKWYFITQLVIWKIMGIKDIHFIDSNNNKITEYDKDVKELEDLVSKYMTLPSFSHNRFYYTINSKYTIKDKNQVLNNYEILESNIDAEIKDNELIINTKKTGVYKISLIRKNPVKNNYTLYYKDGNASLFYPGSISDLIVSVHINVSSGEITINKKDSEDKNRKFANLENSIYGIYNDEELITTLKTNENGIASIKDIPLGKYYIKELTPSKGYKLDENIYEINLTNENRKISIDTYGNIIKGNLIINTYCEDNNEVNKFEIYDINDNLVGAYETKNGIINEKLDYGQYYIVQKEGNNQIDKFNISIEEEKDYTFNLSNDKEDILIVEVPNTKKFDYEIFIPIIFIIIGLTIIFKSIKKTTH